MKQESFWGLILVVILFNYALLHFKGLSNKRPFTQISSNRTFMVFILLTIFGIVGLQQGDYFGYWNDVKEIANTSSSYGRVTHMEPQYEALARLVHGNYLLWRFVIFGGQFAILLYYLKKLNLYSNSYLYLFIIMCLHGMVVGRSTWGIILFFSATLYAIQSKDYKHLLLAPICVFSHSSMIILLAALPLIFFKLNKKSLLLFGILYLAFSYALSYAFDNIALLAGFEQTEIISQKMESYADPNRENSISFFGNSIGSKLSTVPYKVGSLVLLIILLIKGYKMNGAIERGIQFLLLSCVFLVIFSVVMLRGSFGAGTLSYRFFDMTQFPLSIAFYYFFKEGYITRKTYNLFMAIFLFSLEISLIVPLYYNNI